MNSSASGAATRLALALATLAVAGCGPDRVTALNDRPPPPVGPAASIANLPTNTPRLYDQYSSTSGGMWIEGAFMTDDFVVPPGQTWTVTQVVLSGRLTGASLPFAIRANSDGVPGGVLPGASFNLAPTASDPNACNCGLTDYLFTLPTPVILAEGTYWLTVGPTSTSSRFIWQSREPIVGSVERRSFNGSSWLAGLYDRAFVLFGTGRQQAQAITFPAVTPNPAAVGGTATLGATASSGFAVSYTSLTTDVCTVSGSTLSYVAAGTCTVTADQAGNDDYVAAERVTQDVTVNQATQAITITSASPAPAYLNGTYAVSATGGASGNPVVISVSPPNVCTVNGNVVRFVGVGTCTVAADQAGNTAYEAAAQVSQTVKVDYRYAGFLDPVKNGGVLNLAKVGQVIPLKWRLTDVSGAPVTTLSVAAVTVTELSCALAGGSSRDQVEEGASGKSGLQNLGDGYYQLNWKAPTSYANSCKTLQLNLGEGSGARTANFAFTK